MIPLMDPEDTIKKWLRDTNSKAITGPNTLKNRVSGFFKAPIGVAVDHQVAPTRLNIWSDMAFFDRFGRKHEINSKWSHMEPWEHIKEQLGGYHRQDLEERHRKPSSKTQSHN